MFDLFEVRQWSNECSPEERQSTVPRLGVLIAENLQRFCLKYLLN